MPNMQDITRRIKSVQSTMQITKAMKMVAASKLRRAQENVIAARPFARRINEVLGRLSNASSDFSHPLLAVRETKHVGFVVVTADKGLCGGYNANVIKQALVDIKTHDSASVVAVGRKGRDFYKRVGKEIKAEYVGLGDNVNFAQAQEIAGAVMDMYKSGTYDEVYLVYSEFVSALNQNPITKKLLPVEAPEAGAEAQGEYIFEPSAEGILTSLIPKYIETTIYRALLEAKASELGARMTAMGSATDNAKDMIAKLTLSFNRARQSMITQELSEIVGGAAALE